MTDPSEENTTHLLQLIGQGDREARGRLISRFYDRLRRLVLKMLRDFDRVRYRQEPEDILQDMFVQLQKAFDNQRVPPTSREFFAQATVIARHILMDEAAKCRVRAKTGTLQTGNPQESELDIDPGQSTQNPFALATWTEFHQKVDSLLTPEERQVFEMVFYLDMTQVEVAGILGLPPKTVSRDLWLPAIKKLANHLPDAGH
jgi:RNA polymerase sigma factor (sigma-70 family)